MKSKVITRTKSLNRQLKQMGVVSPYTEYNTGEDAPMRPEQRRKLSDYINLISDPLDREGRNRELESGLSFSDADDLLRVLCGEMYWK